MNTEDYLKGYEMLGVSAPPSGYLWIPSLSLANKYVFSQFQEALLCCTAHDATLQLKQFPYG